MITPRRGYLHHAIYVGGGRAVHYGGLSWGLYGGPVEEVPLSHFSQGRPIWVRVAETEFEQHEVVRRARLRLGEDLYSVLTNNCEHFCEWCVRGKHRSYQIDDRIVAYARVLLNVIDLVARNRRRRWQSATADLKKLAAPRNVVEHLWKWLRARYARQRKLRRETCKL